MALPGFITAKDYPEALNKISFWTFWIALAAFTIIRVRVNLFDRWLDEFFAALLGGTENKVTILGVYFTLGNIIPSILISLLFRMFKFHDRVSDVFGIRQNFDFHYILLPMAHRCKANWPIGTIEKIRNNRKEIMYKVFYTYLKYVDGQLQSLAIDQWSWYWILLKVSVFSSIVGLFLLLNTDLKGAAWSFIVFFLVLAAMMPMKKFLCGGYARREIEQILLEPGRRSAITAIFHAL